MTLPHPVLRRAAAEVLHGFSSLATQVHAKKKKEETIVSSEKQALFSLASCLWICIALEKCIKPFNMWNSLRKLEIFVQRNQSTERMPTQGC